VKKLAFIFIGFIILSCQDIENCGTDDNLDFIILRFFDLETQNPKTVGFVFTADGSPYRFPFLADTSISSSGDTTIVSDSTFVLLPLNPLSATTTLQFDSDTSSHLIELSYEPVYSIFDPDCEPSLTFKNIDTVRYTFDSLSIPGTVTNSQLSTNVEVYF